MTKFTADFETTTDPNDCRVWAYGICDIKNPNKFMYGNSLDGFMKKIKTADAVYYFHNLKFDGEFIMVWLFEHGYTFEKDRKKLEGNMFTTLISDRGVFYSMEIVHETPYGEVRTIIYDSLKILPFSVERVAKAFGLPISKLEIDYDEYREPGHILTGTEVEYIMNDVKIIALALHTLFEQGLTKMTQGSNAMFDFKRTITTKKFKRLFPAPAYDADVRLSYKGGWTYLNPRYKNKTVGAGIVLDVNSLYPYVMHDMLLPYSEGIHFEGKYEPDEFYTLYVQFIKCNFELKPGYLPTIQIKSPFSGFIPTEYLSSSDGKDVSICLTSYDLELFFEHYEVYNIEFHGGWKFKGAVGLCAEYIDKWMQIKIQSTIEGNEAMRTLAKLMLNALYGKFALNPNVCSKYPLYDSGVIRYKLGEPETRKPVYIPMGTFITAGARYTTITAAQKVYDRFIYADTDSLHLEGTELPEGLNISNTVLGAWKHESTFSRAKFIRQKCYLEEIENKLKVTCAGMPDSCHQYVTWDNFKESESFIGKLKPQHVPGGIVLVDTSYTIKKMRA